MKKTIKTITMVLMFTLLITACDKDKKNDVNTSTKANTDKGKGQVQTTIIEVTGSDGEAVTNSNGEKVTQVVTIPTTTKAKDKATTNKETPTTAKPTTTKATNKGMSHWVTDVSQNPYGYANAWGTIAQMENDCKAYAESIGLKYDKSLNLGNGHWITPSSSYGAKSSQDFKDWTFEDMKFEKDRTDYTYTTINVLFVTMDNYKDGRCVGYEKETAELYLCGTTDKIIVYIVVG
ncbi:MAG: hypothetical protein GX269_01735 [Clostridiales bacterium]|nr:hypothetical protein [Clostridiales bacterium]